MFYLNTGRFDFRLVVESLEDTDVEVAEAEVVDQLLVADEVLGERVPEVDHGGH